MFAAFDKLPREGWDWFNALSQPRIDIFLGRPANPLSSHQVSAGGFTKRNPREWSEQAPAPIPPRPVVP